MKRTVVINEIEPSPLSLRAAVGLATVIDFRFRDQDDKPYTIDLAAQIKIQGRTGGETQMYPVPATDRLNGKARAVIPAGVLTDPNGYMIRLVGTYDGAPMMFASGTIIPYPVEANEAVPEDTIDQVDIVIERGTDYILYITLWQDTGKTIPLDMTSSIVTAAVEKSQDDSTVLADFAVTAGTEPSTVVLTLPTATIATLPDAAWWRLRLTQTASGTTTLAEGSVTVINPI